MGARERICSAERCKRCVLLVAFVCQKINLTFPTLAEKPLEASVDRVPKIRAEHRNVRQDNADYSDSSEEEPPGANTQQTR